MSEPLLNQINSPEDLKKLSAEQLPALCEEIRNLLISTVSVNGGHLASNLGVVELTVALHLMFESPSDQIVWDVGHQCYTHKILTGRRDEFATLRAKGGISGFPKRTESPHDAFVAGHSSTSVSAALGLAKAKTLNHDDGFVVAVLGDGALTGGMVYEAMNNAGRSKEKLIVILNDNKMSINRNVGAIARYLAVIRSRPFYFKVKEAVEKILRHTPIIGKHIRDFLFRSKSMIKNALYHSTIFEDMGFAYLGPIDGHDLDRLCTILKCAKNVKRPVLIHVNTIKGKGYAYAEKNPKVFHGLSGFDVETGDMALSEDSFSEKMGGYLCALAERDDKIAAVTAAMKSGTGLTRFASEFKCRFFDVGIAEEHAVTFSAGLAANGMRPVFAVYSTFLQRGYDQIIHDAALQKLKVVLAIDRCGIVGDDGETHQGVFDCNFLNTIPNVTIYTPTFYDELQCALYNALYVDEGVAAVRYPRGSQTARPAEIKGENCLYHLIEGGDKDILLVTYGRLFSEAYEAFVKFKADKRPVSLLKLNRVKPLPLEAMEAAGGYRHMFFFEEAMRMGGVGEHFAYEWQKQNPLGRSAVCGIEDRFIPQNTVREAIRELGLDADGIYRTVMEEINKNER